VFLRTLIILFAVFQLQNSTSINAQVSLGINLGLNRSKFSGDAPSSGSFGPTAGPMAGLQFDYRFNQTVSLRIQPGYLSHGANYVKVDSNNKVSDSLKFVLDVLALPVHAVIWSKNGRFFVSAGLEFDYYLKARAIYPDHTVEITPEVKRYNIYAQFGGGFIISLGRPYILFELRYSQGLVDLTSDIVHEGSYLPRTKLTSFCLMAGFHLPLGKTSHYTIHKKE
jgi:hypothetical protein